MSNRSNGRASPQPGSQVAYSLHLLSYLLRFPNVASISPVVAVNEQIIFGAENENTTVDGVSPDYQTIENWTLSEGLWFSTTDQAAGQPVAVIGQTVVQNLFTPTGTDPRNQTIRIGNQLFRVVGVLAAKGQGSSATADNVIFVPYTTALDRLANSTYVTQILVATDSAADVTQVQQGITSLLEQRHHILKGQTDDFNTESSAQLLQTANQLTSTITLLLVGVASISLTVGGIGITRAPLTPPASSLYDRTCSVEAEEDPSAGH